MTNPTSPQNAPYKVIVEKDKTYFWCACGLSKNKLEEFFLKYNLGKLTFFCLNKIISIFNPFFDFTII